MHVGEEAQLVCPSDIAYGDHGHPPTIPGGRDASSSRSSCSASAMQ